MAISLSYRPTRGKWTESTSIAWSFPGGSVDGKNIKAKAMPRTFTPASNIDSMPPCPAPYITPFSQLRFFIKNLKAAKRADSSKRPAVKEGKASKRNHIIPPDKVRLTT